MTAVQGLMPALLRVTTLGGWNQVVLRPAGSTPPYVSTTPVRHYCYLANTKGTWVCSLVHAPWKHAPEPFLCFCHIARPLHLPTGCPESINTNRLSSTDHPALPDRGCNHQQLPQLVSIQL